MILLVLPAHWGCLSLTYGYVEAMWSWLWPVLIVLPTLLGGPFQGVGNVEAMYLLFPLVPHAMRLVVGIFFVRCLTFAVIQYLL